jgi:aconitase A
MRQRQAAENEQIAKTESKNRAKQSAPVKLPIDTPIEIDYYLHGEILPFVLRQLLSMQ